MKIKITDKRLEENGAYFKPQTEHSAAIDLRVCIDEPVSLAPNVPYTFPVGFQLALAENHCAIILPRSGLGTKGIVLANTIGLIDPDYRGEVKVSLLNRRGREFVIHPLDRVAQMLVLPFVPPSYQFVDELDETARGENGFGSTGMSDEEPKKKTLLSRVSVKTKGKPV